MDGSFWERERGKEFVTNDAELAAKQALRYGAEAFDDAVRCLKEGRVICYPTETFFAAGCNALDPLAVEAVYVAKRRSGAMPLPIILGDESQLSVVTDSQSSLVDKLGKALWPGALTILVTASNRIPAVLTGESGRVAVRVSPHPVASQLSLALGAPLVSSSANISGRPAVSEAKLLDPDLLSVVGGVLDMPPAPAGGKPSSLVEVVGANSVRFVRHGAVSQVQIEEAGFIVVP